MAGAGMLVRRLLQVGVLTKDTLRYPARHASTKGWCCSQLPLAFGRVTAGFGSLSAYDTQRIKEMYLESDTAEISDMKTVLGALALYLDFINLFMLPLQLFSQRRRPARTPLRWTFLKSP